MLRKCLWGLLFLGVWVSGNTAENETSTPDFSGHWVLVEALSEDARSKLQEALHKSRGGRRGPPQGAGRGGPLPIEAQITATPNKARQRNLGRLFWAAREIDIKQTLPLVNMLYDARYRREVYTDGRSNSISATGPKDQSVTYSVWENNQLVIETTENNGAVMVERFSFTKDDVPMLHIETNLRMTHLEEPVTVVRVYQIKAQKLENSTKESPLAK